MEPTVAETLEILENYERCGVAFQDAQRVIRETNNPRAVDLTPIIAKLQEACDRLNDLNRRIRDY